MNREKRQRIFERLRAANPNPTTELQFSSSFELLIAVILSAQATDKGVNKATAKLFPIANTPQALLDLGLDGLKSHIKTIGLFNSKARNIIKTCDILLREGPKQLESIHIEAIRPHASSGFCSMNSGPGRRPHIRKAASRYRPMAGQNPVKRRKRTAKARVQKSEKSK